MGKTLPLTQTHARPPTVMHLKKRHKIRLYRLTSPLLVK